MGMDRGGRESKIGDHPFFFSVVMGATRNDVEVIDKELHEVKTLG
jgi:hypothetical protein